MKISCTKLWKLMIRNHLKKKDIEEKAELHAGTMSKLAKNECVNLSVLVRICSVLNCDI